MEPEIIAERTRAGLVAAVARGRAGGRPPALDEGRVWATRAMLVSGTVTAFGRARQPRWAPSTLRHFLGDRAALAGLMNSWRRDPAEIWLSDQYWRGLIPFVRRRRDLWQDDDPEKVAMLPNTAAHGCYLEAVMNCLSVKLLFST